MNDRNVTLFDEKQRVIDLTSYDFDVPSVGIYDEPVRYYKANLQWAKIIEGHVDFLAEVAAWKNAEDENFSAIQNVLIFLEGIELNVNDLNAIIERLEALEMALNQMCEDVKCGVIAGFEELASRVLLAANKDNVLSDIAIGKDDSVITISNPPSQPPGVVDANALELANGLTYGVGVGLREFFLDLNSFFLDGLTSTVARDILAGIYDLVDFDPIELEGAISDYWSAWNANTQSYIPNAGKVSEFVWLYGASKKTLLRYALYVQKDINLAVGSEVFSLIGYLSESQIAEWYQSGAGQPRQDYITYPDYRIPNSNVFTITPLDLIKQSPLVRFQIAFDVLQAKPPTNRWAIKCSGVITNNVLNKKMNCLYYQNASSVYVPINLSVNTNGSTNLLLAETFPPNNQSTGEYNVYFNQTVVGNTVTGVTFNSLPSTWLAADCTGFLTVQRIDLGKV